MGKYNKSNLRGFWKKLTQINGWCLLIAAVVIIAEMICLEVLLSPGTIKGSQQSLYLAHDKDDHTHVAWEALNSNRDRLPIQVYVIGGSTIREGLYDTAEMSRLLSAQLGRPAYFGVLGSSGQTLAESLYLSEALPITRDTTLVVQVNPWRFSYRPWEVKVPFVREQNRTELLDYRPAVWRERDYIRYYINKRISFPFFENLVALIKGKKIKAKSWQLVNIASVEKYNPYNYTHDFTPKRKRKMTLALKKYHLDFVKHYQANLQTLKKLIEVQKKRGVNIILLQGPHSDSFLKGWGPHWVKQDREVAQLCRQEGILYLRVPVGELMDDSDFIDLSHPNQKGRDKFSHWIVQQVARTIDARH